VTIYTFPGEPVPKGRPWLVMSRVRAIMDPEMEGSFGRFLWGARGALKGYSPAGHVPEVRGGGMIRKWRTSEECRIANVVVASLALICLGIWLVKGVLL